MFSSGWESRELYEKHGVPWKRGMIFVGPPGNGKTHMIKALVNQFSLSALYVRGFKSEYGTDAENISNVFGRARASNPSMLIFEDLDTLVDDENRSHFLNELDGFALNSGILSVASANDPANLDPALANRPSRFDRRYVFGLPETKERARYLAFFSNSFEASLRLSDSDADAIASLSEGFSYAYLKELVLSSMMSWISGDKKSAFGETVKTNVAALAEQMTLEASPTPPRAPIKPDPMARYRRPPWKR
jgi:SpoVK/Ycf46/Vps4 family AAA+-type ATPase